MTAEQIARTVATRFKKGQKSHTELFDGAVTIRWSHPERGGQPHWYIRISKGIWQELQIFEWERINGPVPAGHVLACKDGDTLNIDVANWFLLTKKENMHRNSAVVNQPDTYIAGLLAKKARAPVDEQLRAEFLKQRDLIEVKRLSLTLNKKLKQLKDGKDKQKN